MSTQGDLDYLRYLEKRTADLEKLNRDVEESDKKVIGNFQVKVNGAGTFFRVGKRWVKQG